MGDVNLEIKLNDLCKDFKKLERELNPISYDSNTSGFSAPNCTINWELSNLVRYGRNCYVNLYITSINSIAQYGTLIGLPNEMRGSKFKMRLFSSASDGSKWVLNPEGSIYALDAMDAKTSPFYLSFNYII